MKKIQIVLLIIFLLAFFGGGLLIVVNNLIYKFLPEGVTEIVTICVLIELFLIYIVSQCMSGVAIYRNISGTESEDDK